MGLLSDHERTRKVGLVHRLRFWLRLDEKSVASQMDTSPVENTIRPITLSRKHALFAGRDEGGHTWARMASLIETNQAEIRTALRHRLRWILVGCTS